MKQLSTNTLLNLRGGTSAMECFALGAAAGFGILAGGPLGWFGAAVAIGQAYDVGCFD